MDAGEAGEFTDGGKPLTLLLEGNIFVYTVTLLRPFKNDTMLDNTGIGSQLQAQHFKSEWELSIHMKSDRKEGLTLH